MRERVVRVLAGPGPGAGESRGTGVPVGPGKVATALHVVADRRASPPRPFGPIRLRFAACEGERWCFVEVPARLAAFAAEEDLALLAFDPAALPFTPPAAALAALPEDEAARAAWSGYGFPDAAPEDGCPISGRVLSARAVDGERRALALFSREAAAGGGLPLAGHSGGPVFVDGRLVGLLRYALVDGERAAWLPPRSEGGLLYAVPAERLAALDPALPLHGPAPLPPLRADLPLPAEPFRGLARFEAEHAPVFFGRGGALRAFLSLLDEAPPGELLLLHGGSGVGKSSFLRAGVLPRLAAPARILARPPEGLGRALVEATAAPEPCGLLVLDQVEEAFTRAATPAEAQAELDALCRGLALPRAGRVVLCLRKEWLPELQEALRRHGLPFRAFLLEPLDAAGVREALAGLAEPRLAAHFGLELEPGLPERVAEAVRTGKEEATGPVLQVALTRLWERARERARRAGEGVVRLDPAGWREVEAEGLGLGDLLRRRLQELARTCPAEVQGGLALEVLAAHITPMGSAGRLDDDALTAFAEPERARALARELERSWLLLPEGKGARRLAHDSLAGVVLAARARSTAPAQAAIRRVEALAPGWREGATGPLLGREDLRLLRRARPFLRALDPDEARLLAASRAHFALPRQMLRASGELLVGGLAFLSLVLPALLLADRSPGLHRVAMRAELRAMLSTPDATGGLPERLRSALGFPALDLDALAWDATALPRAEWLYVQGRAGAPLRRDRWDEGEGPRLSEDLSEATLELLAWLDGRREAGLPPPEWEVRSWDQLAWPLAMDRARRGLDPRWAEIEASIPPSLGPGIPATVRRARGERLERQADEEAGEPRSETDPWAATQQALGALEAGEAGRARAAMAGIEADRCAQEGHVAASLAGIWARLGDEARVRACLAAGTLDPSPAAAALLALGAVDEAELRVRALAASAGPFHAETDLALVAGLAVHGRTEAAAALLARWEALPLGEEALRPSVLGVELPLAAAWLRPSGSAEVCVRAALLSQGHARLGEARLAHLYARRCENEVVRALLLTQALAALDGRRTWVGAHLPAHVGVEGMASRRSDPTSYGRLWLLDTRPSPVVWGAAR